MAKYIDIVCLTGESHDLQSDLSERINEGYEILNIHSQFMINEKGYDKPKSIIWLQKKCEVTYG